jgi:hypothetical protein
VFYQLPHTRTKLLQGLIAIVGVAATILGVAPMFVALGVSNALIDDGGIEPGEFEIMDSWDTWAFSSQSVCLTLFGLGALSVLFYWVPGVDRRRYFITALSVIGICLILTMFIHGWFFPQKTG